MNTARTKRSLLGNEHAIDSLTSLFMHACKKDGKRVYLCHIEAHVSFFEALGGLRGE